jgi:hypothetical protein
MPGAHWGSQYQDGAAIFLSASKAREKARSHREHGLLLQNSPASQDRRAMLWNGLLTSRTLNPRQERYGVTALVATL